MKNYLFITAVACAALVSCNKKAPSDIQIPSDNGLQECSFMAFNGIGTKGYVEDELFADTPYNKLHKPNYEPTEVRDARTMLISSYLTPQSGFPGTYFKEATYKYSSNDNLWHNFDGTELAPIYWPIGGQLDFLALSVTKDIADGNLIWNEDNVAQSFTLKATDDFKQDDILFASVCGRKIGTDPKVEMKFNHAQAWIQFQLNAGATTTGATDIVTVQKVELVDIYSKGNVTVYNNLGNAFAKWDFREETRKDVLMDDTYGVTGAPLVPKDGVEGEDSDTIGYMDMLIPEQQKTAFLITYTLKGQEANVLTYYYELEHENWLMGHKYIYKIDFGTNEITVQPSVVTFDRGTAPEYQYPEN